MFCLNRTKQWYAYSTSWTGLSVSCSKCVLFDRDKLRLQVLFSMNKIIVRAKQAVIVLFRLGWCCCLQYIPERKLFKYLS